MKKKYREIDNCCINCKHVVGESEYDTEVLYFCNEDSSYQRYPFYSWADPIRPTLEEKKTSTDIIHKYYAWQQSHTVQTHGTCCEFEREIKND